MTLFLSEVLTALYTYLFVSYYESLQGISYKTPDVERK